MRPTNRTVWNLITSELSGHIFGNIDLRSPLTEVVVRDSNECTVDLIFKTLNAFHRNCTRSLANNVFYRSIDLDTMPFGVESPEYLGYILKIRSNPIIDSTFYEFIPFFRIYYFFNVFRVSICSY